MPSQASGTTGRRSAAQRNAEALLPEPFPLPEDAPLAMRVAWVSGQLPVIQKDGQMNAPGQNYRYTSVDQLAELIVPLMARAQLALVPHGATELLRLDTDTPTRNNGVQWTCVVRCGWALVGPDGDTLIGSSLGMSLDSSDKGLNKAQRFAEKNALQAYFHPSSGEDPDAHAPDMGRRERQQPAQHQPAQHDPEPTPEQKANTRFLNVCRGLEDRLGITELEHVNDWMASRGAATKMDLLTPAVWDRVRADLSGATAPGAATPQGDAQRPGDSGTAASPADPGELGAQRMLELSGQAAAAGLDNLVGRLAKLGYTDPAQLADDTAWETARAAVAGWSKAKNGEPL